MATVETDILIIGAGPGGAIAAALLHRAGIRTLVVEKQRFPRFVIGESMLPSSMNLLRDAGVLEAVERQNFMHKHGAVFLRGSQVSDFDFGDQFSDGFEYTFQVPRADFDKALADEIQRWGVDVRYEHAVAAVDFETSRARATVEHAGGRLEVEAKFIVDCSGYGRVLPRLLGLEEPSSQPPRAALFTHVTGDKRPAGREEGKIWICLHPGGAWIWIIPFSNGRTSIGVVGDPEFFAQYMGDEAAQLRAIIASEPNAARRLAGMEFVFPPRRIAGYSCAVKKLYGERFALAGNASEFLDPVFSSGVALAMASSQRAAQLLIRQFRGESVNWQADYADHFMQGVSTLRHYVNEWYSGLLPAIFFADHQSPELKRQICSVLAGYVWDKTNPCVTKADRALAGIAHLLGVRPAGPAR
jgi:flavin-dependent dehydrogenase